MNCLNHRLAKLKIIKSFTVFKLKVFVLNFTNKFQTMILFLLFDGKKKDKIMVAIISIILSKSTCMIA